MLHRRRVIVGLAGLGLFLGTSAIAAAEMSAPDSSPQRQFERIQQPLAVTIGVVAAGMFLIGLELWWFLLSKPKVKQSIAKRSTTPRRSD
jgi:plastocyanin domain-containing protein